MGLDARCNKAATLADQLAAVGRPMDATIRLKMPKLSIPLSVTSVLSTTT